MVFANILYQIMKEEDLTQKEICRRTGFSASMICALLHKRKYPSYRAINHILDTLGYELVLKKKDKRGKDNDI